jgi:hypothetical protein
MFRRVTRFHSFRNSITNAIPLHICSIKQTGTSTQLTPKETAELIYKHVIRYDPTFTQDIKIIDSDQTSIELDKIMGRNEIVYFFDRIPAQLREKFILDYMDHIKCNENF